MITLLLISNNDSHHEDEVAVSSNCKHFRKGFVFLICAIIFFNISRMNKLKSFFSGGINLEYESQNQNQTSHQSLTVDENATIKDAMMHHPTIRHNNQTITGASTGIIDTNIPDQMRLTMLDVTPDDIQVIS